MITHHPIFSKFSRIKSRGTGSHIFDFVGSATDVTFRRGWSKHAVKEGADTTPAYPPVNEHYFDWIATLTAVDKSEGTFRMAELGAGWAPWLVRAALAARQRTSIKQLELVAVEADEVHFEWVKQHFANNGIHGAGIHCLRGAVAGESGTIRFPKVDNPDENYGASTRQGELGAGDFVEVQAFSLSEVLGRFSGPVNLVHVDIQGAEYDAIPSTMDLLQQQVQRIMVGTHISLDRHHQLAEMLCSSGWREVMNFERNALCATPFGTVQFDDGFLLFENTALL